MASLPWESLRPRQCREAQELFISAPLAPFAASNIAAKFCERIFCSDSSMTKGAVCASPVRPEVAASLWLSTDKKGCYTLLEPAASPDPAPPSPEEDAELDSFLSAGARPHAFDFDVLCVFAGSRGVADSCAKKGPRVSPITYLSGSPEFNVSRAPVLEWLMHLIWTGRGPNVY